MKSIIADIFLSATIHKDCYKVFRISNNLHFNKHSFYSFISPYDVRILNKAQKIGFIYISSRVGFKYLTKNHSSSVSAKQSNKYIFSHDFEKTDVPEIMAITRGISKTSRFYKDVLFRKYVTAIYNAWIDNSLFHHYVSDTLFVRVNDKIAGYITLKTDQNKHVIDLIGVAESNRHQGVGTALMNFLKEEYSSEDIYVGTEAENLPAMRFYLKNGFTIDSYELIFHKHT